MEEPHLTKLPRKEGFEVNKKKKKKKKEIINPSSGDFFNELIN